MDNGISFGVPERIGVYFSLMFWGRGSRFSRNAEEFGLTVAERPHILYLLLQWVGKTSKMDLRWPKEPGGVYRSRAVVHGQAFGA